MNRDNPTIIGYPVQFSLYPAEKRGKRKKGERERETRRVTHGTHEKKGNGGGKKEWGGPFRSTAGMSGNADVFISSVSELLQKSSHCDRFLSDGD